MKIRYGLAADNLELYKDMVAAAGNRRIQESKLELQQLYSKAIAAKKLNEGELVALYAQLLMSGFVKVEMPQRLSQITSKTVTSMGLQLHFDLTAGLLANLSSLDEKQKVLLKSLLNQLSYKIEETYQGQLYLMCLMSLV